MARFNANGFNRKMREAHRRAEQQLNAKWTESTARTRRKVIADHNARVRDHNHRANAHNKKVITDLNRQLRSASSSIRYTEPERRLADRVHGAVAMIDPREYDSFLSYARINGAEIAGNLRTAAGKRLRR